MVHDLKLGAALGDGDRGGGALGGGRVSVGGVGVGAFAAGELDLVSAKGPLAEGGVGGTFSPSIETWAGQTQSRRRRLPHPLPKSLWICFVWI